MGLREKQISIRGVAKEKGLETLVAIPIYTGHYLNFNNHFIVDTLNSATDYASTAADPALDAVTNSEAAVTGDWYRYHTSGSPWDAIAAPVTVDNTMTFLATTSPATHAGVYQKLSNLIIGQEYSLDMSFHDGGDRGTLTFSVYYPSYNINDDTTTYIEVSSTAFTTPLATASTTFTATTVNDIVLFDFTTAESSAEINISSLSIQKKDEYLVPVFETNGFSVASKVLRQNIGNTFYDETDS